MGFRTKFKKYLKDVKIVKTTLHPNYLLLPVLALSMDDEGTAIFNEMYAYCLQNIEDSIIRTKSRGICTDIAKFNLPAFDLQFNKCSIVELTILDDIMIRVQIRCEAAKPKTKKLFGRVAFSQFKKLCLDFGIDLDNYRITNGEVVKAEIEKPLICCASPVMYNMIFKQANHIDFHNSYPAGLANTHPEFRPVIEYLYAKRKYDDQYKAMLNYSIGFMQSVGECHAQWAHLSRDAIKDNNNRIRELSQRLEDSDRIIIAYNTDGIWYAGEPYHGSGEGDKLGEWHNDHTNCTVRFKSAGSYEYTNNETGEYTPVVRGYTNLDKIKNRDNWQWGDIYKEDARVWHYEFVEGKGLIRSEI